MLIAMIWLARVRAAVRRSFKRFEKDGSGLNSCFGGGRTNVGRRRIKNRCVDMITAESDEHNFR